MKVLKFGGTSVGSVENLNKVFEIVKSQKKKNEALIVVCSALGGVTDQIISATNIAKSGEGDFEPEIKKIYKRHKDILKAFGIKDKIADEHLKVSFDKINSLLEGVQLLGQLPDHSLAHLVSFGERLSCYIIAEILNKKGVKTRFINASNLIKTDSNYLSARVDFETTDLNIQNEFAKFKDVAIVTGFIGSNRKGHITTLGRGGSDFTASIFAAALNVEEIQIWTDVNGVLTADPRKVDQAFTVPSLSYLEAMELSHFGAKVIYPPTIQPVLNKAIPLKIKNTSNPEHAGTSISLESVDDGNVIKGISSISNVTILRFEGSGLVGVIGMAARLFSALSQAEVNIIFLTQGSSEHSICFGVLPADAKKAKRSVEAAFSLEIKSGYIQPLIVEENKAIVAVIGERMHKQPGIAAKMFKALGKNGINISAIAQGSSELNITAVIDNKHEAKALNALHEIFFKSDYSSINLFIVGPSGLIGGTLLEQIKRQSQYLKAEKSIEINVTGLINSTKMLIDSNGIDLNNWESTFKKTSTKSDLQAFIDKINTLDFSNSVFVDCSASSTVVEYYEQILEKSISVVTPNKIANTLSQKKYDRLRQLAKKSGASFLYETNVGAGLPVISTLDALQNSGDKILKIEAVLSGSLSFIFNSFKGEKLFSDIVKEAQQKGYTEPDPRDDLSGLDVARKALILSREIGISKELGDFEVENLIPKQGRKGSVEEFFNVLKKNDKHFSELKAKAEKENKVLRYMAMIDRTEVKIGLQAVDSDHPFYQLSGSDNMIVFTSERYRSNPLVIKGPGAGAEVTAAGVFAEIISIGNYMEN
ncbi:MAG: bifunctional aspartate kinase/homoserine dehydrogenase I [Chitinophagales bacterium]